MSGATGRLKPFIGEEINYSDLLELISNEELIPLRFYKINDFNSVNLLHGKQSLASDPTNPDFLLTNSINYPLIVQALNNSKISSLAFSEEFPEDIIYLDINKKFISVVLDIDDDFTYGFDGTESKGYVDLNYHLVGGGFKHYLYVETLLGNYIEMEIFVDNDYNVTIDYSDTDLPTDQIVIANNGTRIYFDGITSGTNAPNYAYINYEGGMVPIQGLITRTIDTINNVDVACDFRNNKFRLYEYDLSAHSYGTKYVGKYTNFNPPTSYTGGNLTATVNFLDVYMFNNSRIINSDRIKNVFIGEADNVTFFRDTTNLLNVKNVSILSSKLSSFTNSIENTNINLIETTSPSTCNIIGQFVENNIIQIVRSYILNMSDSRVNVLDEFYGTGAVTRLTGSKLQRVAFKNGAGCNSCSFNGQANDINSDYSFQDCVFHLVAGLTNTGNQITRSVFNYISNSTFNVSNPVEGVETSGYIISCTFQGSNFKFNKLIGNFSNTGGFSTARTFDNTSNTILGETNFARVYTPSNSLVKAKSIDNTDTEQIVIIV